MEKTTSLRRFSVVMILPALVAVAVAHLWTTGDLPASLVGPERYLATLRQYLDVPAELGLLLAATMLLVLGIRAESKARPDVARAHGFVWSVVIMGAAGGMLVMHPYTLTLWMIVAGAVATLYLSSESLSASRAFRLTLGDLRGHFGAGTWVPVVMLLLTVAVTGQALSARASVKPRDQASMRQLVSWYKASTPLPLADLLGGNQTRLAVFTDYQCPTCSTLVPLYQSVISAAKLKGQPIELLVYDFPLEPECNGLVRDATHPMACEAAAAARLVRARAPDQFADFESWLYGQQTSLSAEGLTARLASMELAAAFRDSYAELVKEVRQDAQLAVRAGVHSTPTLFLQGVKLPTVTPRGLEALVDAVTPVRTTSSR